MIERQGDLWSFHDGPTFITTNGSIARGGLAVMGRGVAKQAADLFPSIRRDLGWHIRQEGNHVSLLSTYTYADKSFCIGCFPVKYEWYERASLDLIRRSCVELRKLSKQLFSPHIYLPRPGCYNGKRDWLTEVQPILEAELPGDKFVVVSK